MIETGKKAVANYILMSLESNFLFLFRSLLFRINKDDLIYIDKNCFLWERWSKCTNGIFWKIFSKYIHRFLFMTKDSIYSAELPWRNSCATADWNVTNLHFNLRVDNCEESKQSWPIKYSYQTKFKTVWLVIYRFLLQYITRNLTENYSITRKVD